MAFDWLTAHGLDLLQTIGIVGGFVFTGYAVHRDEKGRRSSNLLKAEELYLDIWTQTLARPELTRVLDKNADLEKSPVTPAETTFVKMLIVHLDTVRRTSKENMFVDLEGLSHDIQEFFRLPIPKAVWGTLNPFQDKEFKAFVEAALLSEE